jgi:hypothetical protein
MSRSDSNRSGTGTSPERIFITVKGQARDDSGTGLCVSMF